MGPRLEEVGLGNTGSETSLKLGLLAFTISFLLVFIGTFSGWVDVYPTQTEQAPTGTKKLLQKIIPRFGLPLDLRSDNGLVVKMSKNLTKVLKNQLEITPYE